MSLKFQYNKVMRFVSTCIPFCMFLLDSVEFADVTEPDIDHTTAIYFDKGICRQDIRGTNHCKVPTHVMLAIVFVLVHMCFVYVSSPLIKYCYATVELIILMGLFLYLTPSEICNIYSDDFECTAEFTQNAIGLSMAIAIMTAYNWAVCLFYEEPIEEYQKLKSQL